MYISEEAIKRLFFFVILHAKYYLMAHNALNYSVSKHFLNDAISKYLIFNDDKHLPPTHKVVEQKIILKGDVDYD